MQESRIAEKFMESIMKENRTLKGIHVSSLSYDCLRKAYYLQVFNNGFNDMKTLMTFWIGNQIHKSPILKEHEVALDYQGIIGSADEYEDGVLIEKKTCRQIPKTAYGHHKKQAEYYKFLLEKSGKPVKEIYILYIDVNNSDFKVFSVFPRCEASIETELMNKKKILEKALAEGKPPERNFGWLCKYCNFNSICFKRGT